MEASNSLRLIFGHAEEIFRESKAFLEKRGPEELQEIVEAIDDSLDNHLEIFRDVFAKEGYPHGRFQRFRRFYTDLNLIETLDVAATDVKRQELLAGFAFMETSFAMSKINSIAQSLKGIELTKKDIKILFDLSERIIGAARALSLAHTLSTPKTDPHENPFDKKKRRHISGIKASNVKHSKRKDAIEIAYSLYSKEKQRDYNISISRASEIIHEEVVRQSAEIGFEFRVPDPVRTIAKWIGEEKKKEE